MPRANTGSYYELSDGTWGVKYRLPDGSQKKRSGFKNKTEARRWHGDNVTPIVNGHRRGERHDMTLRELVDLYLERHAAIRSPRTIRTLRERLVRPLDLYGDLKLSELETMTLELAGWRATLPTGFAPKVMGALRQVLAAVSGGGLSTRTPRSTRAPTRRPTPRRCASTPPPSLSR